MQIYFWLENHFLTHISNISGPPLLVVTSLLGFTAGQPLVSTLIIVTQVNSTGESNNTNPPPANFTQVVENTYTNTNGNTYVFHYMKGSQTGVTLSLQPGSFSVYELSNNNKNIKTNNPPLSQPTYDMTYSGDCRTIKSSTVGTYRYGTKIFNLFLIE
jgi:hypothetical protein